VINAALFPQSIINLISDKFVCQSIHNFLDKFCAPVDVVTESSCIAVQRGNSEVSCLSVSDSSECAIRLAEGKADFGVFNAEELLLINQFYPSDIEPIIQLRHRTKQLGSRKL